mmetsp:Transcript_1484/g.2482  ORF Transcript_1484/g.2482 Transcript_1484/m.2482 type:complete len:236 (-) Transcript_1484:201-908(-)
MLSLKNLLKTLAPPAPDNLQENLNRVTALPVNNEAEYYNIIPLGDAEVEDIFIIPATEDPDRVEAMNSVEELLPTESYWAIVLNVSESAKELVARVFQPPAENGGLESATYTFVGVKNLPMPSEYCLQAARANGLLPPVDEEPAEKQQRTAESGEFNAIKSSTPHSQKDLDGEPRTCSVKGQLVDRMRVIRPLFRLWSEERRAMFAQDLVLDSEQLWSAIQRVAWAADDAPVAPQ